MSVTSSKSTEQQSNGRYPELPPLQELASIDAEILDFWKADKTFEASVSDRPEDNQFVFYDGPPFANGLPHYGHLLTGFAKDIIPRFQTMKGKRVERRFGWDTHGLPAELSAEKDLGISGRKAILDLGIDKFNAAARAGVMKYAGEWEEYVTRQARWVDFENDYKTLDTSFMESCLWAFKQLWDKGAVYKDYRVVPYSWAVESPLSNFETKLDNSYRARVDPAVTVGFEIADGQGALSGARILIWTTTPWTLPMNLAVAVGADLEYAVMAKGDQRFLVSVNSIKKYKKQLEGFEQQSLIKGADLEGLRYIPPFDYFADHANAFRVLVEDFVVDGDGTGVVHMAPGFGEDDLNACRKAGIEVVVPVDSAGRYTAQVRDYEGTLVLDANKAIIARLKEEGKLFRHDTYEHSYPHCWRTDEPLIYRAVESWYVEVSKYRDRMVELNEQISWTPEHVKDGIFGNWLANAQDWNISRSRFWGTPIPVWVSDDPNYPRVDVYGSIKELEDAFGVEVTDLHRPFIDELVRPNPDDPTGKSMMRRVEDVFDVWFDSGSMPFASVHYPFENKDWFEQNFPADFIVEYVAQTRGWFYTLMVLGTMIFDQPPFKNAICHGVVLDENRQKLSKRLRNYPDPLEFFNKFGSDVMRWFLISSPVLKGGDLLVPNDDWAIASTQRETIAPLVNSYNFFILYANLETRTPQLIADASEPMDQYILTKLAHFVTKVSDALEAYDIALVCKHATGFFDTLTNWYIRRSRARFWGNDNSEDKAMAFDTLYTVLVRATQVLAPVLPILSEKLYKSLTGERSVHLTLWPDATALPAHDTLVETIDMVRDACSSGHAVRERFRLRARLPMKTLTIAHPKSGLLEGYVDLIKDELNVRSVVLTEDVGQIGALELKVNPTIGRRLGQKMKTVMAASKTGDFTLEEDGTALVGGEPLGAEDFTLRIVTEGSDAAEPFAKVGAVLLDVSVDEDQEQEGLARDIIRAIQVARKEAGLRVEDRIALSLKGDQKALDAAEAHKGLVTGETLAVELVADLEGAAYSEHTVQSGSVMVGLAKVGA